jgi:hypothetical protein
MAHAEASIAETGRQVADDTVATFGRMFDLSLTKDKMMDMMPGLLLFLARRPEMVEPVLATMMPMMKQMDIAINDDLLVEMMPSVVKAVDREPALGGAVFARMVPMMKTFGLKMNLYIMGKVMGMMMGMVVRHPRVIPGMMVAMPKML